MSKDKKNLYSLDSLKLRIKLENIKIINSDILDIKKTLVINSASGEIISEKELKSKTTDIEFKAYKIKIAITSYYDFNTKNNMEFLEIYLHSKILESNYFSGITKENVKSIFDKLMVAKVFECSYETFLNSAINDIDIKTDLIVNNFIWSELTKNLSSRSIEFKKLGQGAKRYENKNLTFNRRETSTLAKPFVKFYDKQLESLEKNQTFFDTYFAENSLHELKRIEATCKRTKDIKEFFNIENCNLKSVLDIQQNELSNFVSSSILKNIHHAQTIKKTKSNIPNLDKVIHIHFTNSIENQKNTFEATLSEFLTHFENNRMNRYRIKNKCLKWKILNETNNTTIRGKEEIEKLNSLEEIYNLYEIIGIA